MKPVTLTPAEAEHLIETLTDAREQIYRLQLAANTINRQRDLQAVDDTSATATAARCTRDARKLTQLARPQDPRQLTL